jgi:hypothetical protein
MPIQTNELGERGESIFHTVLTRFHGRNKSQFTICMLGPKQEALDFIVQIRGSKIFRYYFLVQVKTTTRITRDYLEINLPRATANKLTKTKAPCYVVAVDEEKERAYIRWINPNTGRGITRIYKSSVIGKKCQDDLIEEVKAYWNTSFNHNQQFVSKFE